MGVYRKLQSNLKSSLFKKNNIHQQIAFYNLIKLRENMTNFTKSRAYYRITINTLKLLNYVKYNHGIKNIIKIKLLNVQ